MATKSTTRKKAVKKTTANTSAAKAEPVKKEKTKHNKVALAIIAAIFIFFAIVYIFRGFYVVATVNGQPITRTDVIKALEKQGGQQVLDSLITRSLITQAADEKKIVIVQADIDKEIKTIEDSLKEQETTLDQALSLQGLTREDLVEDIRLQLMIQKLVEEKVGEPKDEEVKKYLEDNSDFFPEGTSENEKLSQAKEQLKQQKISEETQNLITELQKNSNTVILFKY